MWIPDYGEQNRCGKVIPSAFVESALNLFVSKRMVKEQQMRWTPRGAHRRIQGEGFGSCGRLKADCRVHLDMPAVLLDDAEHHRQTQAGATFAFGGENCSNTRG